MTYPGKWHGKKRYFGLHYDLHAGKGDTKLGTRCGERELVPMLRLMNPDWVQTDCKGHAGYVSWFSRTPDASIPPGLKKDALEQWRAATHKLGLPLHCHYSGIWDRAAGEKRPEWAVMTAGGQSAGAPFGANSKAPTNDRMCPRGPYVKELMIPQLLELIDHYAVNGFWIDGDIWAVTPCYCPGCRKAFTRQTGIQDAPTDPADPAWPRWWQFMLDSFERYVTLYCDAVHAHRPGVLVCSNWLQTIRHPGEPKVPTDWISGDNSWVWGMDGSRCEARFLSTRGKPWDIMLWNFYCSHGMGDPTSPWTTKPPEMLMQEAAVILSFGGAVQVYENASGLRDGRLIPWRQERLGAIGKWVKKRRTVCQDTTTIPQLVVLHSETHVRNTAHGKDLFWSVDMAPVRGAVFSLLENHFGVDIMDEWALLPRLAEFPVVVAPEQHAMSDEMRDALRSYVEQGGRLVVSGADAFDRFGPKFLGVTKGKLVERAAYYVRAAGGAGPVASELWRLVRPKTARAICPLGRTPLLDDELLPHPAATINKVGKGAVAYVPCNVFRDFDRNRYPLVRAFVGEIVRKLAGPFDIQVSAPACVDVALRRKGDRDIIHFVNRASGIPNQPNNGAIDEIPPVGPLTVVMKLRNRPIGVARAFEKGTLDWTFAKGTLRLTLSSVLIHEAVVVDKA